MCVGEIRGLSHFLFFFGAESKHCQNYRAVWRPPCVFLKEPSVVLKEPYRLKRALYIRKRALYILNRALNILRSVYSLYILRGCEIRLLFLYVLEKIDRQSNRRSERERESEILAQICFWEREIFVFLVQMHKNFSLPQNKYHIREGDIDLFFERGRFSFFLRRF